MSDDSHKRLVKRAVEVRAQAYAPYSKFQVGACVLTDDASVHIGVNVENVAFPLGQCAEGGAIAAMVASGQRKIKVIAIAGSSDEYCVPCGGCRQKIHEFGDKDTVVLAANNKGDFKVYCIDELLPDSFSFDQ